VSSEALSPEALRAALVEQLRSKGCLRSPAIAEAFFTVPRHLFVPEVSVEDAYRDRWIATKRMPDGEVVSSSSQPEIMATMLEQLAVRPGHHVLEIGAGTGYNAALLAHLVGLTGSVTTVDIDDHIVTAARAHLAAAAIRGVRVVCADGWAGLAEDAPYDRIIVTVGAHDISPAWRAQLSPSGRLLLPLSLPAVQACVAFDERAGVLESASVRGCIFMRLRGAAAVPMRPVAVGPEPAPLVWPRGAHTVDGAVAHALLQTLPTDLVVPRADLHDAIVVWLGLHEPTSAWFTAQGEAVTTRLVPAFFDGSDELSAASAFSSRPALPSSHVVLLGRPTGSAMSLLGFGFTAIGTWGSGCARPCSRGTGPADPALRAFAYARSRSSIHIDPMRARPC
jgi:protein-L-isoaspartate(D-aspartate) O-methyltransferase